MLPLCSTHYDAERKEWSGPKKKDHYNESLTLGEVIYEVLQKNPNKVIQINDVTGEQFTCRDLLNNAEKLTKQLLKLGLKTGDVLGLYAVNSTHVITVMLASFLCGTPVNALFAGFDQGTVASIFKSTQPKVIFCDVENLVIARDVNDELHLNATVVVMNGVAEGATTIEDLLKADVPNDDGNFRFPCLDLHGDDTAMILCSSGTTGPPKGVLCSNRALLNQVVFLNIHSTSVIFGFSAMYWASGVWCVTGSLLNACLRIVTPKSFKAEYFLELVKRYQITHVISNSGNLAEVIAMNDFDKVQQSLTSIDTLVVGGAKVPLVIQEKMQQFLAAGRSQGPGLVLAYGMSELSGLLSYNGPHPYEHLAGSEGKLRANNRVRIINKEGQCLGPNERGEIVIRSPYKWSGYCRNEEATRKALIDNWLHTGDVGYFNDEGFLHVCGRDNDVFKYNNFQIYPQIIEDIIIRLRGVLEVCVFGIPDLALTHLTACAVMRTSDEDGLKLTAEDVEKHVQANIGSMYHLVGGVYFLDDIPKTGSGKVQRAKVLELVMKMKGGK